MDYPQVVAIGMHPSKTWRAATTQGIGNVLVMAATMIDAEAVIEHLQESNLLPKKTASAPLAPALAHRA